MFEAIVLVCLLSSPVSGEECVAFKDTWGPYVTEDKCEIRIEQMARDLYPLLSMFYIVTSVEGTCIPTNEQLA